MGHRALMVILEKNVKWFVQTGYFTKLRVSQSVIIYTYKLYASASANTYVRYLQPY